MKKLFYRVLNAIKHRKVQKKCPHCHSFAHRVSHPDDFRKVLHFCDNCQGTV